MTQEPGIEPAISTAVQAIDVAEPAAIVRPAGLLVSRGALYLMLGLAALAFGTSLVLWQKLSNIQEQLARQSQDSGTNAIEARTLARQAQEIARETAARQALTDTRLSEVAMQRSQVEELVQSMSRSRDENLLVDIEAALRLAQQQALATGSVEPLMSALRAADQRLERSGQPRLSRVRGAVGRDIDRVRTASTTDIPGLLVKLDELVRQVDDMPLANAVSNAPPPIPRKSEVTSAAQWWERALNDLREEARSLVRVNRIDQPEAVLLAPEQSFFLRENLKLRLLNARLALLSRQVESARTDVEASVQALRKYFDPSSRKTQGAMAQLQQMQSQLRVVELPRIDESLAVIATAAAGR